MNERAVLLLSQVPELAGRVEHELRKLSETPLRCIESLDGVKNGCDSDDYSLMVIHVNGDDDRGRVDELLWLGSTARRRVPVIVVTDRYDQAEALTFFRMGVADYLSLQDHRPSLGAVIDYHSLPRSSTVPGSVPGPLAVSTGSRDLSPIS